jgi:hypothetical protein
MAFSTHKYKAIRTEVDGISFSSKLEAGYYKKLKLRLISKDIKYFLRQVPFHLPGNVKLVVDFLVFENDGSVRYIETKGMMTPIAKLKIKQTEAIYPIKIEIIKKI